MNEASERTRVNERETERERGRNEIRQLKCVFLHFVWNRSWSQCSYQFAPQVVPNSSHTHVHLHTHTSKHMHSRTHTQKQHGGQVATSSLCLHISPTHTYTHVIQTHTFTIYTVTRLTRCARRCVYHDQLSKTNPNLPSRCRCCRRRRRGSCIERARERNLTNSTSERTRAKLNSQRVSSGRESEEDKKRERERSGSKPAKQQQQSE